MSNGFGRIASGSDNAIDPAELLGGAEALTMEVEAQAAVIAIGRTIRAAREAAGLSQAELARRASTTQPHLNAIERARGRRGPGIDLLTRLGRALGTPFTVLPASAIEALRLELERATLQVVALQQTLRQNGIEPPGEPLGADELAHALNEIMQRDYGTELAPDDRSRVQVVDAALQQMAGG
ncbi:MAG: helix-turn-helix transcriptional regulator [Geminicoccaceae bacterium]